MDLDPHSDVKAAIWGRVPKLGVSGQAADARMGAAAP